jgi:thiol-disulfide isomerase/thioredoxin
MDNKLVRENIWRIGPNLYFYSYTAEWCNPCKRIKPHLLNSMKKYKNIESKDISLGDFKKINKFVPYFVLKMNDNSKTL